MSAISCASALTEVKLKEIVIHILVSTLFDLKILLLDL